MNGAAWYHDEMRTKFGFDDGDNVPPEAQAVRTILIDLINGRLEEVGSNIRAYACNRGGVHNPYLLLYTDITDITKDDVEPPDEASEALWAIDEDWLLSNCINVSVSIDGMEVGKLRDTVKAKMKPAINTKEEL